MLEKELNFLDIEEKRNTAILAKGVTQSKIEQVFESSLSIHEKYVDMARQQSPQLEPLKRAIYMQWISYSTDNWHVGIHDLNKEKEKAAIEMLNDYISRDILDKEFISMIAIYYAITDWFADISDANNKYLKHYFRETDKLKEINLPVYEKFPLYFKEFDYDHRGQMGDYLKNHHVYEKAFLAYENAKKTKLFR